MFPRKTWVHLHVMDLGTNVSIVFCLCMGDGKGNMAIEANKVRFHCGLDQWGEVGGLPYTMEYFIAVREEWGKCASAHLKPRMNIFVECLARNADTTRIDSVVLDAFLVII